MTPSKATAIANDIGVTAPEEPSKKQKADYDKLAKQSGDAFDKQFIKHMVMDHKKDISEYMAEARRRIRPPPTRPRLSRH